MEEDTSNARLRESDETHSELSDFDYSPEEFRALGHQIVELMAVALESQRQDPILKQATGKKVASFFDEPLPQDGRPAAEVFSRFGEEILEYSRRNGHPRFFGYVCPSADPVGVLADGMASALNQAVTSWRSAPAATAIEHRVIHWVDEMVGFQGGGSGLLVGGGSAANLHGLACAMADAGHRAGLSRGTRNRLTLYVSKEAHVSMRKAGRLLGLPDANVRSIEITPDRKMDLNRLRSTVMEDLAAGLVPAAICASAGTANTGTVDPLSGVADLCDEFDIWYHIDGAYGAPAVLTDRYQWMSNAFSRASSMSLDPHKWLFAPSDVGVVLFRDPEAARRAFSEYSEYTEVTQTDAIESYAFFDYSVEMSRRFRALKVWTILQVRGVSGLRKAINRNIELREYLDRKVQKHPEMEALGSELSISCFRYRPAGISDPEQINRVNRHILETLLREGRIYMSPTTLEGRYSLRICIVNFRTRAQDIDLLFDEVLRVAESTI